MSTADLDRLAEDVDRRLLAEHIEPTTDREGVLRVVTAAVDDYCILAARNVVKPLAHPADTVAEMVSDVCDYGVLGEIFALSGVGDVVIKGEQVRYHRDGVWCVPRRPTTERRNIHVIRRLIADAGVPLDDSHPTIDGVQVLGGKGRLAGAIPPVSPVTSMTIRLFGVRSVMLEDLVFGDDVTVPMLSGPAATLLSLDLSAPGAVLISGPAGSGKSTLMSGLLAQLDGGMRPILCEEYREINFAHILGVSHQIKIGPDDDRPERSIAGLVRLALREFPSLVAVGEVRGREAWDLTSAASVGAGFVGTIHASSATQALQRLARLSRGHKDQPEPSAIRETFSELLHFVVHCARGKGPDGHYFRQVVEIIGIEPPTDPSRGFSSVSLFHRPGGLGTAMEWTGLEPHSSISEQLEPLLGPGETLRDLLSGRRSALVGA